MTHTLALDTPVGPLVVESDGSTITRAWFANELPVAADEREPSTPLLHDARQQLEGYFAGTLEAFDLPVGGRGTSFQQRVWSELVGIPFGETTSYGALARRLGMAPGASRAIGLANGANPIAIVVPCHRVIGSNGKLVGYAAGLTRKRFLLDHESSRRGRPSLFG